MELISQYYKEVIFFPIHFNPKGQPFLTAHDQEVQDVAENEQLQLGGEKINVVKLISDKKVTRKVLLRYTLGGEAASGAAGREEDLGRDNIPRNQVILH